MTHLTVEANISCDLWHFKPTAWRILTEMRHRTERMLSYMHRKKGFITPVLDVCRHATVALLLSNVHCKKEQYKSSTVASWKIRQRSAYVCWNRATKKCYSSSNDHWRFALKDSQLYSRNAFTVWFKNCFGLFFIKAHTVLHALDLLEANWADGNWITIALCKGIVVINQNNICLSLTQDLMLLKYFYAIQKER